MEVKVEGQSLTTHVARSWTLGANRFGFLCALFFMTFHIPASMAVAQSAKLQARHIVSIRLSQLTVGAMFWLAQRCPSEW